MEESKPFNPYVKVPPEEEIVISGIAGRFPDSDNVKVFQENLLKKVDLGSEDNRRWSDGNAQSSLEYNSTVENNNLSLVYFGKFGRLREIAEQTRHIVDLALAFFAI